MLQRFDNEIWLAEGSTVSVAGFAYPTRMVVIRLTGGGLFVWSPVALSARLRTAVDALGPVEHLVAPNTLHNTFVSEWQAAYPAAQLHALPDLSARRGDIAWHDDLADLPAPWGGDIDQVVVGGNAIATEVVFFHRRSGTVIFTDLIQHFDRGWFRGWRALVARLDLLTAADPTVPRKFRVAFYRRRIARLAVQRIMAWPIKKVVMAHGEPVTTGGHEMVARAFGWLLR